jgi:hypothetical protein
LVRSLPHGHVAAALGPCTSVSLRQRFGGLQWHRHTGEWFCLYRGLTRAEAIDTPRCSPDGYSSPKPNAPKPHTARPPPNKQTDDGLPVHSFRSLLDDLATVTHDTMAMAQNPDASFVLYPQLTQIQARAFQLLDVAVSRSQYPNGRHPNP